MISNKILKFGALMLLAQFSFATSPYWFARYAVGGISYAGGNIYTAATVESGSVDDNTNTYSSQIQRRIYMPLNNTYESMVTDGSSWGIIYGMSTDSTGTGFVVTDDHYLDYLQNGRFVKTTWTFEDRPYGVSYTGNAVYVVAVAAHSNDRNLYKCNAAGESCHSIDSSFGSDPLGVSFDSNGNGFVITNEGHLDLYRNDKFVTHVHTFDSYPMSVSYPGGNSVYVGTEWDRTVHKCVDDGTNTNTWHCGVISKFTDEFPAAISFDSNGSGYVLSIYGGMDYMSVYLNRYEQDKYISDEQIGKYAD